MSLADLTSARERLAEACLELVRIPSVTGDEAAITQHLERWAVQLPGVEADDIVRQGNALIVGTPDDLRPCVALVGHTDTVPPPPERRRCVAPRRRPHRRLGRQLT